MCVCMCVNNKDLFDPISNSLCVLYIHKTFSQVVRVCCVCVHVCVCVCVCMCVHACLCDQFDVCEEYK